MITVWPSNPLQFGGVLPGGDFGPTPSTAGGSTVTLAATGAAITGGSAALDRALALAATGAALTLGLGALDVQSSLVQLAATGAAVSGATAALDRVLAVTGAGAALTAGAGALDRARPLAAVGAALTLGTANLFVLIPGGPSQVGLTYFPDERFGTIVSLPLEQPVRLTATFLDAAGAPVDPGGVAFYLLDPAGTETEYVYGTDNELVREDTGVYYVDWPNTVAGVYTARFDGTGGNAGAVEGYYFVEYSPITI